MHHSVWTKDEVNAVQITHLAPKHWTGTVAYAIAQTLRFSFDLIAGFKASPTDLCVAGWWRGKGGPLTRLVAWLFSWCSTACRMRPCGKQHQAWLMHSLLYRLTG